jgi:hypothetical protein
MVTKVNTQNTMNNDDIKRLLVEGFEKIFNESVEQGDVDPKDYDAGDNIVAEVTSNWNGVGTLVGFNNAVKALGFNLTGEISREVVFSIT